MGRYKLLVGIMTIGMMFSLVGCDIGNQGKGEQVPNNTEIIEKDNGVIKEDINDKMTIERLERCIKEDKTLGKLNFHKKSYKIYTKNSAGKYDISVYTKYRANTDDKTENFEILAMENLDDRNVNISMSLEGTKGMFDKTTLRFVESLTTEEIANEYKSTDLGAKACNYKYDVAGGNKIEISRETVLENEDGKTGIYSMLINYDRKELENSIKYSNKDIEFTDEDMSMIRTLGMFKELKKEDLKNGGYANLVEQAIGTKVDLLTVTIEDTDNYIDNKREFRDIKLEFGEVGKAYSDLVIDYKYDDTTKLNNVRIEDRLTYSKENHKYCDEDILGQLVRCNENINKMTGESLTVDRSEIEELIKDKPNGYFTINYSDCDVDYRIAYVDGANSSDLGYLTIYRMK